MRISLLMEREPFGDILSKTLEGFLPRVSGIGHTVSWLPVNPGLTMMRRNGPALDKSDDEQLWLCNAYLNAIFVPEAQGVAIEPVRREFAHSTVGWRRPLQRAYVNWASHPLTAPWLAQATVVVAPPVPGADGLLILGGNHKLRLLDRRRGLVYAILKDGFDRRFLAKEIESRRLTEMLGLPVPPLKTVAPDGTWYVETYVEGAPINRLDDPLRAQEAFAGAQKALDRLYRATGETTLVHDYAEALSRRILDSSKSVPSIGTERQHELEGHVHQILAFLGRFGRQELTTVTAHGDFQPGNILVHDGGIWLIDWEYSTRRQVAYDALVYFLQSRFPNGLDRRLRAFWENGATAIPGMVDDWPGPSWKYAAWRRLSGALFLLEELDLHLAENANPVFFQLGRGLETYLGILHRLIEEGYVAVGGASER